MCVDMSKMAGDVSPSDIQSTNDAVVSGSDINWGDQDNAADFFRADKAMMSKMNIKKADVKPAEPMSIKPKSKSKSKPKSTPVNDDDPNVEYDIYGNAYTNAPNKEIRYDIEGTPYTVYSDT